MSLEIITNNSPKVIFRQIDSSIATLPRNAAQLAALVPPTTPGLSPGDILVVTQQSPGSTSPFVPAQVAILVASQPVAGGLISQFWQNISPGGADSTAINQDTAPTNQT